MNPGARPIADATGIRHAECMTRTSPDDPARVREPAHPAVPAAVRLENVSRRYGRRRADALHDVSVSIPRGTFTAVMGLSGSGKSTFLHCASGLDRPTSGQVWLGDVDITAMSRRDLAVLRRKKVGFVFQALNLVPTLTVAENIALPLRLDGQRVRQDEVSQAAGRMGIAAMLRRLPDKLSGGEQQRVAIARALITGPEVIFADEPTAALDPYTAEVILNLLRGAVDDLGQTVVVVTHQPETAAYADRALVIDHGRLAGDYSRPAPGELGHVLMRLGGEAR
jgi:putative ABC transport system ATP-binding protein